MNNLVITKNIMSEIYDDNSFKATVAALLNSLIDAELQKEDPDFDFIDECADVLIEVQSDNPSAVIPFIVNNKFNGDEKKRKTLGILLSCAVVFSLSLGAVAVNHTIEKNKEAQTTTVPTTVQTAQTPTTAQNIAATTVTNATTATNERTDKSHAIDIKLNFPDSFKFDYLNYNDFTLDGITASVKYSDGTVKTVNINDCNVSKGENFGKSKFLEKITVEYDGVKTSFNVTFSYNVPPITTPTHIDMGNRTEEPRIYASSKYVEIEAGKSLCITLDKNNAGFVSYTTDNNNLDNISLNYLGGSSGNVVYMNITAGSIPGKTKVFIFYESDKNNIMEEITVEVLAASQEE